MAGCDVTVPRWEGWWEKVGFNLMLRPNFKIHIFLQGMEGSLGVQVPSVYRVPCLCGASYIGQMGRTVQARCKEHDSYIHLKQLDKSALVEHWINKDHQAVFDSVKLLAKVESYGDRVIRETTETLFSSYHCQ